MDHVLQFGVERDQKRDGPVALGRDLLEVLLQQRGFGLGREIGGEFGRQLLRIGEGKFLGVGLDEEVEGIDDREFGGEIDLDLELLDQLGKHVARQPVAVRVLLPIDEVIGRRDLERIARHPRAAVGRRTQPDRLRPQRDRPVVEVAGDVMQADENRQTRPLAQTEALVLARRGPPANWRRPRRACQPDGDLAPRSAQFGGACAPSVARKPAASAAERLHRRDACGKRSRRRSVAQLVEHRSPKPGVGGSSPSSPASVSR